MSIFGIVCGPSPAVSGDERRGDQTKRMHDKIVSAGLLLRTWWSIEKTQSLSVPFSNLDFLKEAVDVTVDGDTP